eukprot:SAG22_NODE_1043_length_5882_cov_148.833132_8_plen_85_part_00
MFVCVCVCVCVRPAAVRKQNRPQWQAWGRQHGALLAGVQQQQQQLLLLLLLLRLLLLLLRLRHALARPSVIESPSRRIANPLGV